MSSFEQTWHVSRVTDVMRSFRPTWHDFGVFVIGRSTPCVAATFQNIDHATRLCAMLNDTSTSCLPGPLEQIPFVDTKRLVTTMKLFCLQENLTWIDCGFDEDEIREANKVLETQIGLSQSK